MPKDLKGCWVWLSSSKAACKGKADSSCPAARFVFWNKMVQRRGHRTQEILGETETKTRGEERRCH